MIFRLYHEATGGHVHCTLYSGKREGALGQCGKFVMRRDEFEEFVPLVAPAVEFRPTPSTTYVNPVQEIGRAVAEIPEDAFLEHLQQTPSGWNAKVSDKIDDRLSGAVFECASPAESVREAIKEYERRKSAKDIAEEA